MLLCRFFHLVQSPIPLTANFSLWSLNPLFPFFHPCTWVVFLLVLNMADLFLCVRYSLICHLLKESFSAYLMYYDLFLLIIHLCIFFLSIVMIHSCCEFHLFSSLCVSPHQNISPRGKEICLFFSCYVYRVPGSSMNLWIYQKALGVLFFLMFSDKWISLKIKTNVIFTNIWLSCWVCM